MGWLGDFRWALNVMRARRFRRELTFSQRAAFDRALRPIIDASSVIAYPDALYHVKVDDVIRAMSEVRHD